MKYHVRHSSQLVYAAPVTLAQFNLRLAPATWPRQRVTGEFMVFDPEPLSREDSPGPYWVNTTRIGYWIALQNLRVDSEFTVEVHPAPDPGDGPLLDRVRGEALAQRDMSPIAPAPYLFASRIAGVSDEIGAWVAERLPAGEPIIPAVRALMAAIHREFAYVPGATTSSTPPVEAFRQRKGVCQDFAHVMIIGLRAQGIAAAYASGYLRTDPPPGSQRLVGADAMHAWANVWCGEELGWIGFDPTNNCLVSQDHIQIGMGRDYADVAPIDGTFIGNAPQSMTTSVDVEVCD